MEFMKYIGFPLEEIKPLLHNSKLNYEIVETFDTKKTLLGNDCRIVNIKSDNDRSLKIYVAYF